MFLRKYWIPLSVFVVAIVGVGFYMLATQPPPEPVKIYKTVKPIEKPTQQPTVEAPPVEDTSQGGHFHADGTWHEGPHDAPVEQPSTDVDETPASVATPTPTESLTYHAELLASHPVEALRQQAQELGHSSADHIPPFPPEDTEAADFARNTYLFLYYLRTGQTDHPEYLAALEAWSEFYRALRGAYEAGWKTPWEAARHHDLMKITWTMIDPLDLHGVRLSTTFTVADGINPESARPLLPFELERHSNNPMTDR